MKRPDGRLALRRANPFVWLAIGALAGALVVGVTHEPRGGATIAAGSAATPATGDSTTTSTSGSGAGGGGGSNPGAAVPPTGGGSAQPAPPAGEPAVGGVQPAPATTTSAAAPPPGSNPSSTGSTRPGRTTTPTKTSSHQDVCGAMASPNAQGVTPTTVKIGFALPDLSVLKAVVDIGNPQNDLQAALAGLRKQGVLPVCGRDIVPAFRTFNVLDPSQSRAACDGFADDDKVFGVVSLFGFAAAECVTVEKKLFLLDPGTAVSESTFLQSPLLYTSDPPIEAQLRIAAYWAAKSGFLDGKTIGVYYNQNGPGGSDPPGVAVHNDLVQVLAQLGHPVKVEFASTTQLSATAPTAADPQDQVAIQKFKAANIQVVFPLEFSSNFFQQAKLQGYHAQWAVYGTAMANDAITGAGSYPADSLDGALGLVFDHVGEVKSGQAQSAQTKACYKYFTDAGNTPPEPESAAGQTLRESCDPLWVLTRALATAGHNLTPLTLAGGMQQVHGVANSYYTPQDFSARKHWGATQDTTEQFHADCTCWKLAGSFGPLQWQP